MPDGWVIQAALYGLVIILGSWGGLVSWFNDKTKSLTEQLLGASFTSTVTFLVALELSEKMLLNIAAATLAGHIGPPFLEGLKSFVLGIKLGIEKVRNVTSSTEKDKEP